MPNNTGAENRNLQRARDWAAAWELPGGSAARMVDEIYADRPEVISVLTNTRVANLGESKAAWRAAEMELEQRFAARKIIFDEMRASGDLVAIEARVEQTLKDGTRRGWPFAVFLYFDASGRIVKDHTYMLPPPDQAVFEQAAATSA